MEQKTKKYNEEDIKKEFTIVTNEEFRSLASNLELPDCMYGSVIPEKEFFRNFYLHE